MLNCWYIEYVLDFNKLSQLLFPVAISHFQLIKHVVILSIYNLFQYWTS